MDKKDIIRTTGGAIRKIPEWLKHADAIGSAFNDVTRKMGY